ncbi:MAG TPA: alpha/beta hydrolase [Dermatophilaceae bacterium]|nr:alpha/beta hydrolase [Dermatophilaceae bacterium]
MTVDDDQTLRGKDSDTGGSNDLQVLQVDGSELAYRVSGDGPPVLLIHGAFGVLEVWDDVQDSLATTHQVISYDRRGHGRSPNGTSDMRVHARDATGLIEHVAAEPAIVVGWSGGAAVAMELIRTHPEQVRAAVLIEPVFHLPRHQPSRSLRLLLTFKRDSMRGRNREAAKTMALFAFARRSGGNGWDELDDRQRDWFLGDAEGLRTEFKVLERFNTSADHISAKEISRWSVPMTYLLGEDSAPWVHAIHDALTKAAPQIRTVRVPGACHLMPLQQPEAVAEAVRSAVTA